MRVDAPVVDLALVPDGIEQRLPGADGVEVVGQPDEDQEVASGQRLEADAPPVDPEPVEVDAQVADDPLAHLRPAALT